MVGDWQLGKTLGAGSMGKVKLATNAYSKERVSGDFESDAINQSFHVYSC